MRILLLTAGSRGDVDPFVALGQHAAARGHEVRSA
jgi:sterol 3beta-glucosyltransferase